MRLINMKNIKTYLFLVLLFVLSTALVYAVEYDSSLIKVTLLNQDPSPARAGDTVELRLRIENNGGGIVNSLELEIVPEYPFSVIDGLASQKLGTLYAYQTGKTYINTQYKMKIDKDAVKGKHELKLRYRSDTQDWTTISFTIDVTSKEFAQIIYVDKAKIEPGKETEMKFTITNIGNAPLQNLIFSWSESNGIILPVFSDDTKYVKYLDVGDSIELKYTVIADVNAKPGLYSLDLSLRYDSSGNTNSTIIKTKAGIFVGGETDFDVSFSESSQGQTSLSVANTGNNPALSVSVKIPDQKNFRVTGSSSSIIGNLDKGDYTVVSFQIVSSMNATGNPNRQRQYPTESQNKRNQTNASISEPNNTLKVVIDYTDTTGQRRSVEKTLPIQFRNVGTSGASATTQSSRAQQSSFWQSNSFIVLVLILAVVFFILYRKKDLREKILGILRER